MARTLQPPTEKVHQIIARTAMFVSKHGGQSEIILRVKQGDNPTFGFLMPGHPLHAYFRFLVEHPEHLQSETDWNSQNEHKEASNEQNNLKGVGGALSLLGSVYGSGEEDGDDTAQTEKDISQDSSHFVDLNVSHGSKNIDSRSDPAKDESVSKNLVLSSKEKVITVKKNSLINASKSGTVKSMGEKSRLSSAADKAKSSLGMTSKIEPLILEPPPELKRLIDKIVEFIVRNGKQFEATLIEQDSEHGRFPFLLPSNQYHSYYLKVLKTAQESKINGTSFYSGKDDLVGRGLSRKASVLKERDFPPLVSALCDMPLEYDRKEKFKMVIGKSKKETQETEPRETQQDCGITVDAASAAAILQAATRGIKRTSHNGHVNVNSSEGGHPGGLDSAPPSQPDNAVEKLSRSGSQNVSAVALGTIMRAVANEAPGEADSSEAHLTQEQKLKAERLKRAKMFVAMLKSGEVPFKTGTSRGTSLEPLDSGVTRPASSVNLDGKEREGSLAPADVGSPARGEKPLTNYFGEEQSERLSKRKYRSRSGGCEDDDQDDGGMKEHNERHSRKKFSSRSRRHDDDNENENAVAAEQKHQRRRNRTYPSSEENEDENGSEEKRDHENYKLKHQSLHLEQEDESEDKYKEDKNHRRSRKKHRSHREHSRKRRSSKRYLQDEDEHDHGREKKRSRKKHHSSRQSRDKHRHKSGHSSRDRESRHNVKHDTSSDDEQDHCMNKHKTELHDGRDELEEGEISSRVSEESRRNAGGHISRETSVDVVSSHQRAPSQPSDTSEVPDDLRAKIRAMLMETL